MAPPTSKMTTDIHYHEEPAPKSSIDNRPIFARSGSSTDGQLSSSPGSGSPETTAGSSSPSPSPISPLDNDEEEFGEFVSAEDSVPFVPDAWTAQEIGKTVPDEKPPAHGSFLIDNDQLEDVGDTNFALPEPLVPIAPLDELCPAEYQVMGSVEGSNTPPPTEDTITFQGGTVISTKKVHPREVTKTCGYPGLRPVYGSREATYYRNLRDTSRNPGELAGILRFFASVNMKRGTQASEQGYLRVPTGPGDYMKEMPRFHPEDDIGAWLEYRARLKRKKDNTVSPRPSRYRRCSRLFITTNSSDLPDQDPGTSNFRERRQWIDPIQRKFCALVGKDFIKAMSRWTILINIQTSHPANSTEAQCIHSLWKTRDSSLAAIEDFMQQCYEVAPVKRRKLPDGHAMQRSGTVNSPYRIPTQVSSQDNDQRRQPHPKEKSLPKQQSGSVVDDKDGDDDDSYESAKSCHIEHSVPSITRHRPNEISNNKGSLESDDVKTEPEDSASHSVSDHQPTHLSFHSLPNEEDRPEVQHVENSTAASSFDFRAPTPLLLKISPVEPGNLDHDSSEDYGESPYQSPSSSFSVPVIRSRLDLEEFSRAGSVSLAPICSELKRGNHFLERAPDSPKKPRFVVHNQDLVNAALRRRSPTPPLANASISQGQLIAAGALVLMSQLLQDPVYTSTSQAQMEGDEQLARQMQSEVDEERASDTSSQSQHPWSSYFCDPDDLVWEGSSTWIRGPHGSILNHPSQRRRDDPEADEDKPAPPPVNDVPPIDPENIMEELNDGKGHVKGKEKEKHVSWMGWWKGG